MVRLIGRSDAGDGWLRHQAAVGEAHRLRHQHLQRADETALGKPLERAGIEPHAVERVEQREPVFAHRGGADHELAVRQPGRDRVAGCRARARTPAPPRAKPPAPAAACCSAPNACRAAAAMAFQTPMRKIPQSGQEPDHLVDAGTPQRGNAAPGAGNAVGDGLPCRLRGGFERLPKHADGIDARPARGPRTWTHNAAAPPRSGRARSGPRLRPHYKGCRAPRRRSANAPAGRSRALPRRQGYQERRLSPVATMPFHSAPPACSERLELTADGCSEADDESQDGIEGRAGALARRRTSRPPVRAARPGSRSLRRWRRSRSARRRRSRRGPRPRHARMPNTPPSARSADEQNVAGSRSRPRKRRAARRTRRPPAAARPPAA